MGIRIMVWLRDEYGADYLVGEEAKYDNEEERLAYWQREAFQREKEEHAALREKRLAGNAMPRRWPREAVLGSAQRRAKANVAFGGQGRREGGARETPASARGRGGQEQGGG